MNLQSIFYITLSIEAIVVTLVVVVVIYYFARFMREIGLLNKKILEVVGDSVEAAEEAREYINKIGKSIVNYLTIKLIKIIRGKK